jgi:hypothetical protein
MTTPNLAAELIRRMLNEYASVSTYSDHGVASSSVGRLRIAFQTSFVRGRRLRFEHRKEDGEKSDRTVIWSDGAHTYTHWPPARRINQPPLIDDFTDLFTAFGASAGVSSGTSTMVPALLLPVSIGASSKLTDLAEPSFDRDELIGPHTCALINIRGPGAGLATFWIDRATYLLRRTVTWRGEMHETTTSYEPSLDRIDLQSIECPDLVRTAPKPREIRRTGVEIATGSRRVESLQEDGPAQRAGLAIGDEIEVVNGQRTDSFIDVMKAFHAVTIGEHLELTIRRGSNTLEVRVLVEAAPLPTRPTPSAPLVE